MTAGQTIHVQAPDGRVNEIIVPDGFGPGSTFTVQFADEKINSSMPPPPPPSANYHQPAPYNFNKPPEQAYYPTAAATPATNPGSGVGGGDDGFVSGFHNPNGMGYPPQTAPAHTVGEAEYDLNSYPTANDAKPVYSASPSYPAATY